ncbi:hypothetical protein ACFWGN_20665 [Oerskovia sp. NPDC060338]|uniref:hypothetical protein n=1 Tax=Oerskovia sp. NPDC060338 TaxID=3347100 RepID=UPI00365D69CF
MTIPDDVANVTLNIEHDFKRPVGRATEIHAEDKGLVATFTVAGTTAGNDLLAEAADGLRPAVSVEIDNPVIRAGALVSGLLTAAGAVVRPAFPSAQLMAEDYGETVTTDFVTTVENNDGSTSKTTEHRTTTYEYTDAEDDSVEKEGIVPDAIEATASAPAGLTAAATTNPRTGPADAASLFATLANAHSTGNMGLLAALDNAIAADVQPAQRPEYAGEIWSNRTHVQKYAPLLTQGTLTAFKGTAWKFSEGKTPTVGAYAGFPAQPVSTEVKTEAFEWAASRIAGAGAIDRMFVDFSTPEFWEGYFRESADSYSRQLDAAVLAHLLTPANRTAVVAGAVPAGVSKAAAFIVDGVAAVQEIAVPTFAIVGSDLYREFLLTKSNDSLEYLDVALGLDPNEGSIEQFKIISSTDAALQGKVLVGAREGAEVKQAGTPIRVDTVNISNGGIETGVFGYHAEITKTAKAFALVAAAA